MKTLFKPLASVLIASFIIVSSAQARTVMQNKGSDTLVNVAQAWARHIKK